MTNLDNIKMNVIETAENGVVNEETTTIENISEKSIEVLIDSEKLTIDANSKIEYQLLGQKTTV